MTEFKSNWKPTRTARKKDEHETKAGRRLKENKAKTAVRFRDKRCRFPLCGCSKIRVRCEVSHDKHKGMGGNPAGDRSITELMVYLCFTRHQDSRISRHAGTVRAEYLTEKGFDGPVAWHADKDALEAAGVVGVPQGVNLWIEIAREKAINELEPLTDVQRHILEQLAEEFGK